MIMSILTGVHFVASDMSAVLSAVIAVYAVIIHRNTNGKGR